jgi:hypothetical protein
VLRRSAAALSLRTQLIPDALPLMCFHKDQLIRIRADATLETCISFGQIVVLTSHRAGSLSARLGSTRRSRRAFTQAKSGPRAASSGLHLRSNLDRRGAPGVRLLKPDRGLVPRQADFIFGQIRTDAMLQACAYSGQIGASYRVKRTSSSVKSGPMQRSKRALTQAKLGPRTASSGLHLRSNQDRCNAPGVHLLRPNRGLVPRQADFIFGHDDK